MTKPTQTMETPEMIIDNKLPTVYLSGSDNKKTYDSLQEMIDECFLFPGPNRVIVLEDKSVYLGKLIIPKTAERRTTTGIILRVGEGQPPSFAGHELGE